MHVNLKCDESEEGKVDSMNSETDNSYVSIYCICNPCIIYPHTSIFEIALAENFAKKINSVLKFVIPLLS